MAKKKVSNTSKVNYEPVIKQPVRPVTLDVGQRTRTGSGDTPQLQLGDFVSPDQLGQISDEDQTIINEFVSLYEDSKQRLQAIDVQLDNILSTMAIPYDPTKFPDLEEAHKHVCGRPGATNVITYPDIQNRWALEKAQVKSTLSVPKTLDDLEQMNSAELQGLTNQKVEKMIAQMLKQAMKQVLVWSVEFFEKIFAPVSGIKFVKIIPKLIRKAKNRIIGSNDPMVAVQNFENEQVTEEGELASDELAQAGGGYISSVKEVAQAIVDELPPQCLAHTTNWNKNIEALVRDTKYAPAYYAKKANMMATDRLESLNKLAAIGIPEGNVVTIGSTTMTYTNPLPEEYLRARADGSTKISAFGDGLVDSVKKVNGTLIPKLERVVKNLLEDPSLLCCLIKNLILMAKMKDLKEILLSIQALLLLYRNFLVIDVAAELAKLGNMIIDLVNSLLQSIFSAYTTLFLNSLSKKAMKIMDLEKLKSDQCAPWNELINTAIDFLTDMLQKIWDYLTGFFVNFNLDIQRLSEQSDKVANLARIDKLLDIIGKIIRFTAAWAACVESKQDPRVILNLKNRLVKTSSGIKVLPVNASSRVGTREVGIGVYNENGKTIQVTKQVQESNAGEPGSPLSTEGLSVLLTNYLGMNQTKAKTTIASLDDCACDKSLSADELREIESYFKE